MIRSEKELQALYDKFDRDVIVYSRGFRFLLAIDQMLNVLIWGGSMDETISSHINRKKEAGTDTWFDRKICCLLQKLEHNHCYESRGE